MSQFSDAVIKRPPLVATCALGVSAAQCTVLHKVQVCIASEVSTTGTTCDRLYMLCSRSSFPTSLEAQNRIGLLFGSKIDS